MQSLGRRKGEGKRREAAPCKDENMRKKDFYLWKLSAVGGGLETAREELEKEELIFLTMFRLSY